MKASYIRAPFLWIGRKSFAALIASGATPNQLTFFGLMLVLVICGFYLWTGDMFVLGAGLSLAYPFDALDGAVARRQGTTTSFGGYLDSVVDRYQEVSGYFAVGLVTGWWIEIFVLTFGCLMVSYTKAATALHTPIDNKSWPDLMERPRRAWLFCASLMLNNTIPVPDYLGGSFAYVAIWYIAVLVNFTAIQRFMRARRLLTLQDTMLNDVSSTHPSSRIAEAGIATSVDPSGNRLIAS